MEKIITERLENLEKNVYNLSTRISQIESMLASVQQANQTNSPYSGNAFQSPYGKPFKCSTVNLATLPIDNETIIIKKLDELLNQFNNNFSRLNWRLEALENQRKE